MDNVFNAIKEVHNEKIRIVESVYKDFDLKNVYQRQTELHSMAITINTDVSAKMIPALEADGFSASKWAAISCRLRKLNFIGIPTESEIKEKYQMAIEDSEKNDISYTITPDDDYASRPMENEVIGIKKLSIPKFLLLIAVQGIAVPLVLVTLGGKWHVLVKVIFGTVAGVAVAVQIVKYFDLHKKLFNKKDKTDSMTSSFSPKKPPKNSKTDMDDIFRKAVEEVKKDNLKELSNWFDELENITNEAFNS